MRLAIYTLVAYISFKMNIEIVHRHQSRMITTLILSINCQCGPENGCFVFQSIVAGFTSSWNLS